ncbi:MAG: signal transduction histidine kinase [Verrucomicrobiales bacterium]|jgi:signal transduction histidine kinase
MTRYYIRVVVIMLLVLVISAIALMKIGSSVSDRYVKPRAIREMNALAKRLQDRLGEKSLAEAEAELVELESRLNFTARLVPLSELQAEISAEPAPLESNKRPTPRLFIRLGAEPFALEIRRERGLDKRLEEEEGAYFIAGVGVVVLIVSGAAIFLVTPLVKKLRAQELTISRIADGDLTARATTHGDDAIARLGKRINVMADRIQDLLANQRQLLQAVSHEMRTPTARIGFALEMLEDARTDEERKRRIAALQQDLLDLDRLLDELLTFLRFDAAESPVQQQQTDDVTPLVLNAVEKARRLRGGITLHFDDTAAHPPVVLHQRYFPRVIDNVLANAVRHANSSVAVSLSHSNQQCFIDVKDDGTGIPEADRERIFEPFIRLDSSRSQKSGGTGLGLAIASRVMKSLGGSIEVLNSEVGTVFRITLLRSQPDS